MEKENSSIYNVINAMLKWLEPLNMPYDESIKLLKKDILMLYNYCVNLEDVIDEKEYSDYDKLHYSTVYKRVAENFKNFQFYYILSEINVQTEPEIHTVDPIDDLADILLDIDEVKWRLLNNSINDGLWYMKFVFKTHIERHIVNLLYYINNSECE